MRSLFFMLIMDTSSKKMMENVGNPRRDGKFTLSC